MNMLPAITPTQARLPRTYAGKGVYFILDGTGRVKIGVTDDIARRMSGIQTGCSTELVLVRFIGGAGPKVERWLHRRFSGHRVQGEWFDFSDEMMTITPPDEVPSIPRVVKRRDVRLTLKERIIQADGNAELLGLTDHQRLLILVQNITNEEAAALCDVIRTFVKA